MSWAAVTVWENGGTRTLAIDNLEVAGTDRSCVTSQIPLGHLPILLHPHPTNAYIVGFGGGGASHAISTYPFVKQIDATELSQSVVDVAPLLDAVNHHVLSDPRMNLKVTDGRHFLLTTQETYDVISVDLLWPQTAGASSLYTLEFYQLCDRRMSDDGIMIQWLFPGSIPETYLKIVVRTMLKAFPHVSLWWSPGQLHIFLVASKSPFSIDFQRMKQRLSLPTVRQDLAGVRLDDPAELLALYIAHDEVLARYVSDTDLLNTDDLPLLEYGLPLCLESTGRENMLAMTRIRESVLPLVHSINAEDAERVGRYEQSKHLLIQGIIAFRNGQPQEAISLWQQAVLINPQNLRAQKALRDINAMMSRGPSGNSP